MDNQTNITKGTKAVTIYTNGPGAKFDARLYVNCTPVTDDMGWPVGTTLGDATTVARRFKSLAGAKKWASKVLGA